MHLAPCTALRSLRYLVPGLLAVLLVLLAVLLVLLAALVVEVMVMVNGMLEVAVEVMPVTGMRASNE